jgi:4-hydroxybutyrate dehydrogenase
MSLISYLTRTHFAEAAIEDALPEEARTVGAALLLMDDEPGVASAAARVGEAIRNADLETIPVASTGPSRGVAAEIFASLRRAGGATIVAIGGAAAITQGRLAADHASRLDAHVTLIAVPVGLSDFGLAPQVRPVGGAPVFCARPDLLIVDPTVLENAPRQGLVAAGLEVLVHAIEAFASPGYNPPADGMALEAARRLLRWLPELSRGRGGGEARRELMAASLTAGLALEKAIGGVDALAHPLESGRAAGAARGDLHAPIMAEIARFNQKAVGDRYARLAHALDMTDAAGDFGLALRSLARSLGQPENLRDGGVNASRFDEVAMAAANDPVSFANPRRLTPGDCRGILEAAWSGGA